MNHSIDETRLQAGFFVGECLEMFGISLRTWYRWCKTGAPNWAHELIRLKAGKLDSLGWKDWQIRNGVLYSDQFKKPKAWEQGELMAFAFLRELQRPWGRCPQTPTLAGSRRPGGTPPPTTSPEGFNGRGGVKGRAAPCNPHPVPAWGRAAACGCSLDSGTKGAVLIEKYND